MTQHTLRTCACGSTGTKHFVGKRCNACYQKARYAANPEAANRTSKEYYKQNKTRINETRKLDRERHSTKHWVWGIKSRYGVTLEQYQTLLEQQNGGCAICKVKTNGRFKVLCVDHDHSTKKVRGLLCSKCNKAIGMLQDSIELLKVAIQYLEVSKSSIAPVVER